MIILLLIGGIILGVFAPQIICQQTWSELFEAMNPEKTSNIIQEEIDSIGNAIGKDLVTTAELAKTNLIYSILLIVGYFIIALIILAIYKRIKNK